ncbi:MAG TPA: histidine phosphatase family protein [Stellaceae bacterium]|nr:histidine phosphatase family protein [Stellaceae bacterium]
MGERDGMTRRQVIYLTRHGETVWNRDGRFQGRRDSPLTARGEEQARRMGEALTQHIHRSERDDWTIVASPLGRAQHTARIIAGILGLSAARIESEARLEESDIGAWTALDFAEIEACSPGALDGSTRHDWYFRAPDGETHAAMAERVAAFLAASASRERLILVAHGVTGRVLRGLYLGLASEAALQLEAPQDAMFRLGGGAVERIDCGGA